MTTPRFLLAVGAAPGVAVGRVRRTDETSISDNFSPETFSAESEKELFRKGRAGCVRRLDALAEKTTDPDSSESEILEVYRELLDDESVEEETFVKIDSEKISAAKALASVFDELLAAMDVLDDDYARSRRNDIAALEEMFLRALGEGADSVEKKKNAEDSEGNPFLLVGRIVSPLDLIGAGNENGKGRPLLGVISEEGGPTSHVAILARAKGIPAIFGVSELDAFRAGAQVAMDGETGEIVLDPTPEIIARFEVKRESLESPQIEPAPRTPLQTPDGRPFFLWANIADVAEMESARRFGADGIGLFRSEFLYYVEKPPAEEEQTAIYRRLRERAKGPVVVRTFDVGGDKPVPAISVPPSPNPALGLRGGRLYDLFPDLFLTQLRAILRGAADGKFGDLKVMFPMIISSEEVRRFLAVLDVARCQLKNEGYRFAKRIPVGVMIETPAAVFIMDELAEMVDFFSLGTNDLAQYALAVDRFDPRVAGLYDPNHPALWRLLETAVASARRLGRPISVCGELASDPDTAARLYRLGVDSLSVEASRIPAIRARIETLAGR